MPAALLPLVPVAGLAGVRAVAFTAAVPAVPLVLGLLLVPLAVAPVLGFVVLGVPAAPLPLAAAGLVVLASPLGAALGWLSPLPPPQANAVSAAPSEAACCKRRRT